MKTRTTIAATALALVSLTLGGCATSTTLEAELRAAVTEAPGDSLMLSSLTSTDGDEFLVVCPYESVESIEQRLGFSWAEAPDYSDSDGLQTVAIIKDKRIVTQAEFDRSAVDFCADGVWQVTPTTASLTLEQSDDTVQVSAS